MNGCSSKRRILERLLQSACQSVQWGAGAGTPSEQLAAALTANAVHVSTRNVELTARITADVALAIRVRVRAWSPRAEAVLAGALEREGSLIAALVRAEWVLVRAACRAADRTPARTVVVHARAPGTTNADEEEGQPT